jgi:2-polyprenyl-3-methyl-5-hydroxy-6-metoxy-1,4-benzoquinol methylase
MSKYKEKENYVALFKSPEEWKNHVNVKTLQEYNKYITGSVLDVGCNHAATTFWLKEFNITNVVGIDVNQESLDHAEFSFKNFPYPYEFKCLDFTQDFKFKKLFDVVICFHTIEHIYEEDIDVFINNVYKNLKKEGHFIVGLPYENAYNDLHHVSSYKEDDLINLLEKHKFTTIECFKDDRFEEKDILTGLFKK